MKNKVIMVMICLLIVAAFALGATGVFHFASAAARGADEPDRLIGVLITRESINPNVYNYDGFLGSFIRDNADKLAESKELIMKPEKTDKSGRIYAKVIEVSQDDGEGGTITDKDFVFEGIDGIRFFRPMVYTESSSYRMPCFDQGIRGNWSETKLEGNIYILTDKDYYFWFNPVYQTAKGDVYVVPGECTRLKDWAGAQENAYKWNMWTKRENNGAASGDEDEDYSFEVKLSFSFVEKPISVHLLQFNEKHELLDKRELIYGEETDEISALPGTEYMMVETLSPSGIVRELYQQKDECVYALCGRDDGICIQYSYRIDWGDSDEIDWED